MNSTLLTPFTDDIDETGTRGRASARPADGRSEPSAATPPAPHVPCAGAAASRQTTAPANTRSRSGPETPLRTKSVVVVEDQGITLLQIRRALSDAGMTILGDADNGRTGVDVVLRERPDIVLMDIRMPEMSGIEAARLIRAQCRTCIVMLTAFATEEHEAMSREVGASGFVSKPVDSSTLLLRMEEAWHAFQAE